MAIYTYECPKCGTKFDKQFKMSEDSSETKCACGVMAKKIPALSTFHLKGGGWFIDGYGGDKISKG